MNKNQIDWEDLRQGYNRIKKTSHQTVTAMLTSLYAKEQTLIKTGDVLGVSSDVLGVSSQTVCNEMVRLNISRLPSGHRGKPKCVKAIRAISDVSQMTALQIAKAVEFSRSYVTICLQKEGIEYRKGKHGLNVKRRLLI
jgi:hypothetical protein